MKFFLVKFADGRYLCGYKSWQKKFGEFEKATRFLNKGGATNSVKAFKRNSYRWQHFHEKVFPDYTIVEYTVEEK